MYFNMYFNVIICCWYIIFHNWLIMYCCVENIICTPPSVLLSFHPSCWSCYIRSSDELHLIYQKRDRERGKQLWIPQQTRIQESASAVYDYSTNWCYLIVTAYGHQPTIYIMSSEASQQKEGVGPIDSSFTSPNITTFYERQLLLPYRRIWQCL